MESLERSVNLPPTTALALRHVSCSGSCRESLLSPIFAAHHRLRFPRRRAPPKFALAKAARKWEEPQSDDGAPTTISLPRRDQRRVHVPETRRLETPAIVTAEELEMASRTNVFRRLPGVRRPR